MTLTLTLATNPALPITAGIPNGTITVSDATFSGAKAKLDAALAAALAAVQTPVTTITQAQTAMAS